MNSRHSSNRVSSGAITVGSGFLRVILPLIGADSMGELRCVGYAKVIANGCGINQNCQQESTELQRIHHVMEMSSRLASVSMCKCERVNARIQIVYHVPSAGIFGIPESVDMNMIIILAMLLSTTTMLSQCARRATGNGV
jgi:hypothetical protein